MKTLQKFVLSIALVSLFASCQSRIDVQQVLSNSETRKAIMDTIANHNDMSKEMMVALMNGTNGKMLMMENHEAMMKMMKDNPGMMQKMMSDMMETCKGDTGMMCSMCKTMMGNKQMMDMMDKANRVIKNCCISEGGVSGTVVDPKKIYKIALDNHASSLILGHYHPSSQTNPSEADNKITKKIKDAGYLLDIAVLDHIIVGGDRYYSYADNGAI